MAAFTALSKIEIHTTALKMWITLFVTNKLNMLSLIVLKQQGRLLILEMAARTIPLYDPQFECLKDIVRLVQARMRTEVRVKVECYYADKPPLAYINFSPMVLVHGRAGVADMRSEPGIPMDALVPEKIGPIAYWVIKQARKKRPTWFVDGEVIELR